jgi:hypothetical protein
VELSCERISFVHLTKIIRKEAISTEYLVIFFSILSLVCVGAFSVSFVATSVYIQNAYGLSEEQQPPSVAGAILIYNNQKYQMSPFVFSDGRDMHKIQYPLADVNPVTTVQEGGIIKIEFSKEPVSANAFIVDYEADVPSVHPLKKLSKDTFELSGVQGIWNLEVHAIFSSNSGVSSISSDKQGSSISNEYASYDLGIDMMPRTTAEDSQNICANNEVGIANVSTNVEQQHLGSSDSNKVFTNYNNNNNNNITLTSLKGENPWVIVDLGQQQSVCSLNLVLNNGDKIVNHFTIQTSTDGLHFSDPVSYDNTAMISGGEIYDLSSDFPVTARYTKVTFQGNTEGTVYTLQQTKILGNN